MDRHPALTQIVEEWDECCQMTYSQISEDDARGVQYDDIERELGGGPRVHDI